MNFSVFKVKDTDKFCYCYYVFSFLKQVKYKFCQKKKKIHISPTEKVGGKNNLQEKDKTATTLVTKAKFFIFSNMEVSSTFIHHY